MCYVVAYQQVGASSGSSDDGRNSGSCEEASEASSNEGVSCEEPAEGCALSHKVVAM